MSLVQLKREIARLSREDQGKLIAYILQLRNAHLTQYLHEVAERLEDTEKNHWLTPVEFERRLDD